MLCGLSLDINLSFSLLASFVCVFTNPDSSELYCVHGPFWLPLYLMGTSIFNSPDKRHYFSFAQFRVFQERMLIVHFILKVMAWGIWAGLPGCCLSDVWVRRTEGRPWKTNLTKNITWRHATPFAIKMIDISLATSLVETKIYIMIVLLAWFLM